MQIISGKPTTFFLCSYIISQFQLSPIVFTLCLSVSENPRIKHCFGPLLMNEGGTFNPLLVDEGGSSVFKPSAYR